MGCVSLATIASPRTASWRLSWASTSATETLKRLRSLSLMLNTTCRLSFKLRASRRSRRTRREPIIMLRSGQRSLHLLDAVSFDDVPDLDVVVTCNFQAALEALAHFADVVLETLERFQARGPL